MINNLELMENKINNMLEDIGIKFNIYYEPGIIEYYINYGNNSSSISIKISEKSEYIRLANAMERDNWIEKNIKKVKKLENIIDYINNYI